MNDTDDDQEEDYDEEPQKKKKPKPKPKSSTKSPKNRKMPREKPPNEAAESAHKKQKKESTKETKEAQEDPAPSTEVDAPPDWKMIRKRVTQIVAESDLTQLSARKLREQLAGDFGDLTEHKKKLKKLIVAAVEQAS